MSVAIHGDGVAAACVARLLTDAQVPWRRTGESRTRLASILLSEQTLHLIDGIFGEATPWRRDSQSHPAITKRIVQWGTATTPLVLQHRGVAASEHTLLHALWKSAGSATAAEDVEAWTLLTSASRDQGGESISFGNLQARFAEVMLTSAAEQEACWVESLPIGWLFLLTTQPGKATLIAAGAPAEELLAASKLVARQIAEVEYANVSAPASPRLSKTLLHSNMLLCGGAAMSFDPLCGEGAGNAARQAYLASAVLGAVRRGLDVDRLAQHYTERLKRGMLRHLQTCLQFYATGGEDIFWTTQVETLREGIAMLEEQLLTQPPPELRLVGRDLIEI